MTTPDTRPTIAPQVGARYTLAQWLRDYAGEFCEEREAIMIRAAADEIDKPRIEPLTVRQRFVMAAMQGLLASNICDDLAYAHEYASGAVRFADATLAEEARTRSKA